MPDLIIPDACIPYIRMQRSRYSAQKVPDPEEVKRRYAAHVAEDYAGMVPYLPAEVGTILEIGCGLAAIEVFMKRRYPDARLELLDGDTVTREGGAGYSDHPDVYSSRAHTEMLLAANGVTVDRWHDIGIRDVPPADLIISMASWGYHYPLSTYRIPQGRGGVYIVDLRRGAEKPRGRVIFKGPKYDRCRWKEERWT